MIALGPSASKPFPELEYSVHAAPASFVRHVVPVFPQMPKEKKHELVVVPVCQKSLVALNKYGAKEEEEKDRLLEQFIEWSRKIVEPLKEAGHWADVTDPASGQAYFGDASSSTYADVEGLQQLLRYEVDTISGGGCRMVRHPMWGLAVYPSTLFTTAPVDVVVDILKRVNQ